nr:hypothetical protein [Tanacetum cinerariifolium]
GNFQMIVVRYNHNAIQAFVRGTTSVPEIHQGMYHRLHAIFLTVTVFRRQDAKKVTIVSIGDVHKQQPEVKHHSCQRSELRRPSSELKAAIFFRQGKLLFFQPLIQKGDQNLVTRRSSKKHKENNSLEDEQQDFRKGHSKLKRWTSHKEKDFSLGIKASASVDIKDFSWYELWNLNGS